MREKGTHLPARPLLSHGWFPKKKKARLISGLSFLVLAYIKQKKKLRGWQAHLHPLKYVLLCF